MNRTQQLLKMQGLKIQVEKDLYQIMKEQGADILEMMLAVAEAQVSLLRVLVETHRQEKEKSDGLLE